MSEFSPPWTPRPWGKLQTIKVYHGTTSDHPDSIQKRIEWTQGKVETDFGKGFYVTTSHQQAKSWAWELAAEKRQIVSSIKPAVVSFKMAHEALAALESLSFVRGDYHAETFWSFVFHCRQGANNHGRRGAKPFYDIVYGPIAAKWRQRLMIGNVDQISFHCDAVNDVLNLQKVEFF